jgi:hypothetical protein
MTIRPRMMPSHGADHRAAPLACVLQRSILLNDRKPIPAGRQEA